MIEHGRKAAAGKRPAWPVVVAVACATLLLSFFAGHWTGRRGLTEAREAAAAARAQYEARLGDSERAVTEARAELGEARGVNRVLGARGHLYRAAVALERRNFGVAQEQIGRAESALGAAVAEQQPLPEGLPREEVAALRAQLSGMNVRVASDVGAQRDAVIAAAERLGDVVGPHAAAAPAEPETAEGPEAAAQSAPL